MKWAIDPALEGDPYADKPYMYSPGVASWNYFRIGEMASPEKLEETFDVHSEVVEEGADGSGVEVRRKFNIPDDRDLRRKHFLHENVRKDFVFEKGREYLVDFGNPYLGFNGEPNRLILWTKKIGQDIKTRFRFLSSTSWLPSSCDKIYQRAKSQIAIYVEE